MTAIKTTLLGIIAVLTLVILGLTIYNSASPSQAAHELSLYSDLIEDGHGNLSIYIYKKSDPKFYKWVYILDQEYDNIEIINTHFNKE